MLDLGLERFETRHVGLIESLSGVGHDPFVDAKWIAIGESAPRWQFTLVCRRCGERHRGWLPKRLRGLSPDKPCSGTGPTLDQWVREGLGRLEAPSEVMEYKVVEVRARDVAEATSQAISQLGLSRDEVEITVVAEGKPGIVGLGGTQAVVWARPKQR